MYGVLSLKLINDLEPTFFFGSGNNNCGLMLLLHRRSMKPDFFSITKKQFYATCSYSVFYSCKKTFLEHGIYTYTGSERANITEEGLQEGNHA
jgi:hypothetical protein